MRPQLEYCSAIWDPHEKGDTAFLEKVQRRAARFVMGDYKRESSVTSMIRNIGWQSLQERRAVARLTLMYKIVHGYVEVLNTPLQSSSCQTRHASQLTYRNLQTNKNCYRHSFFPRTIPEWNSLPFSIRSSSSVETFKTGLTNLNIQSIITIITLTDC